MCFKLYKKEDIAVWPKLSDNSCYKKLNTPNIYPTKCDDGTKPDSACDDAFKHDNSKWKTRVKHYKKLVTAIGTAKMRNVMDMNTMYGGFAATLIDYPLWVMNVVSLYAANTLVVVYDRGLTGTYHDWVGTDSRCLWNSGFAQRVVEEFLVIFW
ncbi:putative methyltransferase PMT21 [Abeliophyllum distichum]|uniref:Methyltransferase n=1 Tax=Abeliophyllum distichum TaxID=126358 RepID=A0ABD1PCY0_9LAMI